LFALFTAKIEPLIVLKFKRTGIPPITEEIGESEEIGVYPSRMVFPLLSNSVSSIIRIDETEFDKLPPGLRVRSVIDYSKTVERPFWMGRLLQFLQVLEDSDNKDALTGQERNTNNRRDSGKGKRIRNSFVRLNTYTYTHTLLISS